jgi:hypothetical protein
VNRLGLITGRSTLELLADSLDAGSASGDGRGVTEVGVDADERLAVVGLDVLDDDVALVGLLAVTAAAVQFAKVHDGETVDGDGALAVVLDHLVVCALSSSANDLAVAVTLEGEGV